MIYIICDMNCNNFGNYFRVIGLERELHQDESSYYKDSTYYPKMHCYRARLLDAYFDETRLIRYSEVIDYLIPEDYVRWQKMRFRRKKCIK